MRYMFIAYRARMESDHRSYSDEETRNPQCCNIGDFTS
jgi:hypothetical protein